MNLKLQGKKVFITGGSRGIGRAIACQFIEEGAIVGIVARNYDDLLKVKKDLGVYIYQADLMNLESRQRVISQFISDVGGIDILVNNAGGSLGGMVKDTPIEKFLESMELNFVSALHLSKLAFSYMKEQGGGAIINISSIYGREAGGSPSYNASKAALISFTKAFSTEAIKDNVRVNGIAPGAIFHLNKEWSRRLKEEPKSLEAYVQNNIPGGRFGKPEEIADLAVFLSSVRSSWIIGATINVDGGQSHTNY